jgi:hypothetical protein
MGGQAQKGGSDNSFGPNYFSSPLFTRSDQMFEYVYSTRNRHAWIIATYGILMALLVFTPMLLVLRHRVGVSLLIGTILLLHIVGAVSSLYRYIYPRQWQLFADGAAIRWITPADFGEVRFSDIKHIAIDDTGDFENIVLELLSGERIHVHPNCCGNLDELRSHLAITVPQLPVTYVGPIFKNSSWGQSCLCGVL